MMFSIKDTQYNADSKIDLSGYATTVTTDKLTISIEDLQTKVANKLNSNPVDHKHSISQIEQLEQNLSNKLSVPSSQDTKYSYNTLLKDWQSIPYLESVKIPQLDIAVDSNTSGYVLSVDATGDLLITINDVVIASYNKASSTWILNGTDIKSFINSTNEVLKNHYDAINIILGKLGLEDSDSTDGNKITPTETTTEEGST